MSFKTTFKENIKDKEKMDDFRYKASKTVFIFISFFFFVSFFLVGAGYYKEFFAKLLSPFYVMLIISLDIYIFYFLKNKFREKDVLIYSLSGVLVLISLGLLYIIF